LACIVAEVLENKLLQLQYCGKHRQGKPLPWRNKVLKSLDINREVFENPCPKVNKMQPPKASV
jgi:hypothetical protein